MSTQSKLDRIATMEQELQKLKEEVEKDGQEVGVRDGDTYWFLSSAGETLSDPWDGGAFDGARLAIGNVFKTREEAQHRSDFLKVLTKLRKATNKYKYMK
jgi:hypothetical protein